VLPAIDKGFFQSEISDAAYRYQREIDEGSRNIVGVNAYQDEKPVPSPAPDGPARSPPRWSAWSRCVEGAILAGLASARRLRIACQGTENTMPTSWRPCAPTPPGEIVSVMKEAFGIYQEPPGFKESGLPKRTDLGCPIPDIDYWRLHYGKCIEEKGVIAILTAAVMSPV